MSTINLLPWRDALKKKKKNIFLVMLLAASLVAFALSYLGYAYVTGLISAQNTRNQFLQTQTSILDKRIAQIRVIKKEKSELEGRINVIQQLEIKRNYTIHLFNTLSEVVPEGIYLKNISFSEGSINVNGLSESNNRVSKMMRNVDSSGWLGESYLSSIVAGPTKPIKLSKFAMKFVVLSEGQNGEKKKPGGKK
jgi:type IV pilus assembly protein PilN